MGRRHRDLSRAARERKRAAGPSRLAPQDLAPADVAARQKLHEIGLARLRAVIDGPTDDSDSTTLEDGTIGYYMRRGDDCWPAALATVLQTPLGELPDLNLDQRVELGQNPADISISAWVEIEDWLATRNLRMQLHRRLPITRHRWIGIVPVSGDFQSHCLVMTRAQKLFDPAERIWGKAGCYEAEHVGYGLSFTRQLSNRRTK